VEGLELPTPAAGTWETPGANEKIEDEDSGVVSSVAASAAEASTM